MRASAVEPPLVGFDAEPDELAELVPEELGDVLEDELLLELESEPDDPGM